MPRAEITLSELLRRLKRFGIVQLKGRGKGSEIILLKPKEPGSDKGPQHSVKDHGQGTRLRKGAISSILSRFEIDPDDFWG